MACSIKSRQGVVALTGYLNGARERISRGDLPAVVEFEIERSASRGNVARDKKGTMRGVPRSLTIRKALSCRRPTVSHWCKVSREKSGRGYHEGVGMHLSGDKHLKSESNVKLNHFFDNRSAGKRRGTKWGGGTTYRVHDQA